MPRDKWNVASLREHLLALLEGYDKRISEIDKRYEQRFQSQEATGRAAMDSATIASEKADRAYEKRFDNTNEWRAAMNDRDSRLMQRSEVESQLKALDNKIDTRWGALDEKVNLAVRRLDKSEGKGTGLTAGWGYLIGLVMLVAGITSLIVAFRH